MEDEDSILPRKLQAALEHILEQRNELASDKEEGSLNGRHGTACSLSARFHRVGPAALQSLPQKGGFSSPGPGLNGRCSSVARTS